eukprot:snap_masked-scaffold_5-processed-gene-7.10-mRNA-1 protein AED:1.00 eAED:1.00 QI:0/0/0/0/1/1/2/0/62
MEYNMKLLRCVRNFDLDLPRVYMADALLSLTRAMQVPLPTYGRCLKHTTIYSYSRVKGGKLS